MIKKLTLLINKARLRLKRISISAADFLGYIITRKKPLGIEAAPDHITILFLGTDLKPRISRLAKWLNRSEKFRCLLLVDSERGLKKYNNDIFAATYTYRSNWNLKQILNGLEHVDIVHGFSLPSWPISTAIKTVDIPVIMDIQDMYVSYFGKTNTKLYMKMDIPHEAFAIEHAAGVVTHSMELFNAYREHNIDQRPPVLFFPLYCDEDRFLDGSPLISNEAYHLVYAGGIAGSFQDDHHFGSMKLFWLIDTLSEQGIYLHIYPSPSMNHYDLIMAEYKAVAENNPFLIMHDPVPQNVLAEELSQYHFGLIPFYLEDTSRSFNKLGRGTSLKMYNYFEANLPVIVSKDLAFQAWMCQRYDGGLAVDKNQFYSLKEQLDKLDYQEVKTKLKKGREKITLGGNTPRLISFYQKIISSS